ncbi:dTMP kinase [Bradyrhizobium sp. USDA 4341]
MRGGKFIVFEGGEGAGKSSHTAALAAVLESAGRRVLRTREPGGRPGVDVSIEQIRALLVTGDTKWDPLTELLLFAAARREHVTKVIVPALGAGTDVICDRFSDSSLAYQGHARGLPASVSETLRDIACGPLRPDLTLVIDVPPEIGLARSARRQTDATRFEQEDINFHHAVREAFLGIARVDPTRYVVIDGTKPLETVRNSVVQSVVEYLARSA